MNPDPNRLNFVFINTDQQRYDTLGCTGSRVAKTPKIDRLASEGILFHRCYTTNPVCMPSRASLFTGQYPSHHGVWMNGVPLNPHADLLQSRLKHAGYSTGLIGKIHLDNIWLRTKKHPSYDFDLFLECEGDPYCKDDYFQWLDSQGLFEPYMEQFKREGHTAGYVRNLPEDKHMNNWIAGHTETYLRDRAADHQPFFLSVGFFDPHHPFDPCEPYASMFRPEDMPMPIHEKGEEKAMVPRTRAAFDRISPFCLDPVKIRKTIAAYHATIAHVDKMVGRIMTSLAETGLENNTVVIFCSDHGEMLGDHGILHKGSHYFEGALHIPLIYRFPHRLGLRGSDHGFASHIDFAPTVAELAGIEGPRLAQGSPLFSRDLKLRPTPARPAALIEFCDKKFQSNDPFLIGRCLRTERWKYVCYHNQDYGELYDLEKDPNEFVNLWSFPDSRQTITRLREELWSFQIDSEPRPVRSDIF